jgi:hypothetical protein
MAQGPVPHSKALSKRPKPTTSSRLIPEYIFTQLSYAKTDNDLKALLPQYLDRTDLDAVVGGGVY